MVNVRDGVAVPFGYRGTVIGVHEGEHLTTLLLISSMLFAVTFLTAVLILCRCCVWDNTYFAVIQDLLICSKGR